MSLDLGNIKTSISDPWKNVGNVLGGIAGLVQTGYNLYTNKRDFDYQKALQQTMFDREDTAVQRRVEDLKAAGFNPNLALGSAASTGSVVARSNTNDVNFGAALDYIQAANVLKQQKEQTQILKYEKEAARMKNENDSWNYDLNQKWIQFLNGRDYGFSYPRLQQYFNYNYNNLKNSSEMLGKQNDWFTANQVINALGSVARDVSYFTPSFVKRLK